jgi:hypothetical protein
MKNLVIIDTREYGREVYNLPTQCKGFNKEYVIKGFFYDNTEALNDFESYPPN